ncbi:MAG: MerR family transcriptional regulator [Anaerolineae bacterium]|nr:MerR family transcriptional regulator [Anaerolineae bacterium]
MPYTTQQVSGFFSLSHQTIKNYAAEFAAYLSPTATPGHNRQRQFTEDDLTVLALVVEMKRSGARYDDIHASLGAGQRGEMPGTTHTTDLAPAGTTRALLAEIKTLNERIRELEQQSAHKDGQIAVLKELLRDALGRLEDRH